MKKLIYLFILCLPLNSYSQSWETFLDSDNIQYSESYFEMREEAISEFRQNPIWINSPKIAQLRDIGLLSNQEYKAIQSYRITYGDIRSINELYLISSLSNEDIRILDEVIHFKQLNISNINEASLIKSTKQKFLLRLKSDFNHPESYQSIYDQNHQLKPNKYVGSPYYFGFKYKAKSSAKVAIGLSIEKDAGEAFLAKKMQLKKNKRDKEIPARLEYIRAYLQIKNCGVLKQFVLGNYAINWGLGLHLGQAFSLSKYQLLNANLYRPKGYLPYAGFSEASYHQGAFSEFKLKDFSVSLFWSAEKLDGSLYYQDGFSYFKQIQTTGYHRTSSELFNADQIDFYSKGFQISYERNSFLINLHYSNHQSKEPKEYISMNAGGNKNYFSQQNNLGFDFLIQHKQLDLQGEVCVNEQGEYALSLINKQILSPNLNLNWAFRLYSPDYFSYLGNAPSTLAPMRNEYAFSYLLSYQFTDLLALVYYSEFSWNLIPPHHQIEKNSSAEQSLILSYQSQNVQNIQLAVKYKHIDKRGKSDLSAYEILGENKRLSFQFQFQQLFKRDWSTQIKYIGQVKNAQNKSAAFGMGIKYRPIDSRLSCQLILYRVNSNNDETPLYYYRSGLSQSFNFGSFYGRGMQLSGKLAYTIKSKLKLELFFSNYLRQGIEKKRNDQYELAIQIIYHIK